MAHPTLKEPDVPLTITTFSDVVRIVETHPEWWREMVKALFPDVAEAFFGAYLQDGRKVALAVGERLYEAVEAGAISEQQRAQVMATDLFWGGQLYKTGAKVILVVEASWLAEESDVSRAAGRAAILRGIGIQALPVVAAREWAAGIPRMARDRKVVVVDGGRVDEESWWSAAANTPDGH